MGHKRAATWLVLMALTTSCGGGDPVPDPVATEPPSEAAAGADDLATEQTPGDWPFDEDLGGPGEAEEAPPDPQPDEADAEILPEVTAEDGDGPMASETAVEDVDPCTLVTTGEWSAWRGVSAAEVEQVQLEGGDACGYRDTADTVRTALAVIGVVGGSWLPEDVASDQVSISGASAQWAEGYPVEVSSVLVVDLGEAELVLEMSARDGTSQDDLRDGAAQLAEAAIGRWEQR